MDPGTRNRPWASSWPGSWPARGSSTWSWCPPTWVTAGSTPSPSPWSGGCSWAPPSRWCSAAGPGPCTWRPSSATSPWSACGSGVGRPAFPSGAHAGVVEDVGAVDGVAAALEVAAVLVAAAMVTAPSRLRVGVLGPALAAVAVLGLTTAAIVSQDPVAARGPWRRRRPRGHRDPRRGHGEDRFAALRPGVQPPFLLGGRSPHGRGHLRRGHDGHPRHAHVDGPGDGDGRVRGAGLARAGPADRGHLRGSRGRGRCGPVDRFAVQRVHRGLRGVGALDRRHRPGRGREGPPAVTRTAPPRPPAAQRRPRTLRPPTTTTATGATPARSRGWPWSTRTSA